MLKESKEDLAPMDSLVKMAEGDHLDLLDLGAMTVP